MSPEDIEDAFSAFGPVTIRKMFGGTGIYAGGVMFALEAFGELYLKADDVLEPAFEALGAEQFVYDAKGKPMRMSYWRLPADMIEDRDAFAEQARLALAAAHRKAVKTPKRSHKTAKAK
ncbi:MAG: TfoX/Sxy family protein [Pseudomonadota bacterium]